MLQNIKNYVLSSGFYNYFRLYSKYMYYDYLVTEGKIDSIPLDIMPYGDFAYFINTYPRLTFYASKLYNSHREKSRRVKIRFANMFAHCGCVLFLTLTFRNDVLSSTSQSTRRRYVQRFLRQFDAPYVANIDFGDQNGREHYHAVIGCDYIEHILWDYGAINFRRVNNFVADKDKIAEYINKLTYHSTKDSAGHLIYSRNFKKFTAQFTDIGIQFTF